MHDHDGYIDTSERTASFWRLCCKSQLCNFLPTLESLLYLLAIRWG
jgi:hypothetical protein